MEGSLAELLALDLSQASLFEQLALDEPPPVPFLPPLALRRAMELWRCAAAAAHLIQRSSPPGEPGRRQPLSSVSGGQACDNLLPPTEPFEPKSSAFPKTNSRRYGTPL